MQTADIIMIWMNIQKQLLQILLDLISDKLIHRKNWCYGVAQCMRIQILKNIFIHSTIKRLQI